MDSISGVAVFAVFVELKKRYGIKQKQIADILMISRQAVTDMKADRRRFTRAMGEKLLQAYRNEPWHAWLCSAVDALFSEVENISYDKGSASESSGPDITHSISAGAMPRQANASVTFPILPAPYVGDPRQAPFDIQGYAAIPPPLAAQAAATRNPYILIVDFDDMEKRLRRGDHVLVLQEGERESEIQIIEFQGGVRVARRQRGDAPWGRHGTALAGNTSVETVDADWVLLDSGTKVPAASAKKVGCVVGIVMALL